MVNGLMEKSMDMESTTTLMVIATVESGRMERRVARELSSTNLELVSMVNSRRIRLMVTES